MILIYGKGVVGNGLAEFCDFQNIPYEIKDDSDHLENYDIYDLIVPSPGIPSSHAVYETNKVASELDFLAGYIPEDFTICSITGTDGKSTTAWMLYEILRQEYEGKSPVYLSGNFEIPLSLTLKDILSSGHKKGYIVLEVSSFMAFSLQRFESDYTILTNLQPDHLDWHSDLGEYYASKMNLVYQTTKAVVLPGNIFSQIPEFETLAEDICILDGEGERDTTDGEVIRISGRKKYLMSETHFSGIYNARNILGATVVTNRMKICSKRTKEYLKKIKGLPHRIETISTDHDRVWIDDGKSTSYQSQKAALESFSDQSVVLIAGGKDKGDEFVWVENLWRQKIRAVALMGEMSELLAQKAELAGILHKRVDSMGEAVEYVYKNSQPGDNILLSPGCSSLDQFTSYLERANQFKQEITHL